jgi:hypothetical protein
MTQKAYYSLPVGMSDDMIRYDTFSKYVQTVVFLQTGV